MSNIPTNPIRSLDYYFYPIVGAGALAGLLTRTVLYCANGAKPRATDAEKLQIIDGIKSLIAQADKTMEENPDFTSTVVCSKAANEFCVNNSENLKRVLSSLIADVNSMSSEELKNLNSIMPTFRWYIGCHGVSPEFKELKQFTISLCKSIKSKQDGKTPEIPSSISPRSMLGIWLALSTVIYFAIQSQLA